MRFTLKLLETDSQFRQMVLEQMFEQLNKAIQTSIPKIKLSTQELLKTAILSEPEYGALTSSRGPLRIEFGIEDPSMVNLAIDNIVNTVNIKATKLKIGNLGISGGFVLTAIPKDELEMISKSFSQFTEKGVSLEWLRWLLYEGANPIVRGYSVRIAENRHSRTGGALMVQSKKSWRVPATYIGTAKNNWITRSIDKIEDQITSLIQTSIESSI